MCPANNTLPSGEEIYCFLKGNHAEVAGEFSNWQGVPMTKRDDGSFVCFVDRDMTRDMQMKFIVDGVWLCDGYYDKSSDEFGNQNNILPAYKEIKKDFTEQVNERITENVEECINEDIPQDYTKDFEDLAEVEEVAEVDETEKVAEVEEVAEVTEVEVAEVEVAEVEVAEVPEVTEVAEVEVAEVEKVAEVDKVAEVAEVEVAEVEKVAEVEVAEVDSVAEVEVPEVAEITEVAEEVAKVVEVTEVKEVEVAEVEEVGETKEVEEISELVPEEALEVTEVVPEEVVEEANELVPEEPEEYTKEFDVNNAEFDEDPDYVEEADESYLQANFLSEELLKANTTSLGEELSKADTSFIDSAADSAEINEPIFGERLPPESSPLLPSPPLSSTLLDVLDGAPTDGPLDNQQTPPDTPTEQLYQNLKFHGEAKFFDSDSENQEDGPGSPTTEYSDEELFSDKMSGLKPMTAAAKPALIKPTPVSTEVISPDTINIIFLIEMMLALCFGILPYARETAVSKLEHADLIVQKRGGWQATLVSLVLRTILGWLRA
ncbi:hypothetical protein BC937DRAFT_93686 [Endogone sp. FLAS-F59071]|nr:hypothetical protein BC937DRAFT_93686 [Endogone sp. FLAS-F59071]|eukprot:RUS14519.1 hypothetical protein BC937DRAFT_93686 [Endogone sp. FLAS-F59071]